MNLREALRGENGRKREEIKRDEQTETCFEEWAAAQVKTCTSSKVEEENHYCCSESSSLLLYQENELPQNANIHTQSRWTNCPDAEELFKSCCCCCWPIFNPPNLQSFNRNASTSAPSIQTPASPNWSWKHRIRSFLQIKSAQRRPVIKPGPGPQTH